MLEVLQQWFTNGLTEIGYIALPLISQIATIVGMLYTTYRVVFRGVPATYRKTVDTVHSTLDWMHKPSKVEILRKEVEELKRIIS